MPDPVNIGGVAIGPVPRIVASIGEGNVLSLAKKARTLGADMIELRLDRMTTWRNPEDVCRQVRKSSRLPVISTIRWSRESGASRGKILTEKDRKDLYSRVLPFTDAVDIEINSGIFPAVAKEARRKKKTVIASYHNFRTLPPPAKLKSLVGKGLKGGGHIVKIAARTRSLRDAGKLLAFCLSYRPGTVASVAMGESGKLARYAAPLFGSALLYGYIDRPYGPGQLRISEIRRSFRS